MREIEAVLCQPGTGYLPSEYGGAPRRVRNGFHGSTALVPIGYGESDNGVREICQSGTGFDCETRGSELEGLEAVWGWVGSARPALLIDKPFRRRWIVEYAVTICVFPWSGLRVLVQCRLAIIWTEARGV